MAQTDRQTDKAIHWNSAVFDNSGNWAKLEVLPAFVKEVHRQKEVCPTTQREHYQIHVVCHRQVRLAAMREWIQTHWKPVRGTAFIANSINYCKKKETSIPGTSEIILGEKYLRIHELLLEIARNIDVEPLPENADAFKMAKYERQFLFKNAARDLIAKKGLVWIDKLSNPAVEKAWNYFYHEVMEAAKQQEDSFIIEESSNPEVYNASPTDCTQASSPEESSLSCPSSEGATWSERPRSDGSD